jgi:hypothetical protein
MNRRAFDLLTIKKFPFEDEDNDGDNGSDDGALSLPFIFNGTNKANYKLAKQLIQSMFDEKQFKGNYRLFERFKILIENRRLVSFI